MRLLQIDCDSQDRCYDPATLRKRSLDDLVEIIQRLKQEAVATGKLYIESKTLAQRVCTCCILHVCAKDKVTIILYNHYLCMHERMYIIVLFVLWMYRL